MEPFRATYMPMRWTENNGGQKPDPDNAKEVMVLDVNADSNKAVIVDLVGDIETCRLEQLSDCQILWHQHEEELVNG